ncbi:MAG: right-handed parallel beta-helix repeat-containing protein [Alphaproteobacteria bacterium]|nr:right-handed parallel beta-helix repeat-containing protein [Alphaproteobacteria bacterium]
MVLLLSSLSVSLAATLVVDPGDGSAYATIGDAVAAASSGDTLALSADTFAECVDLDGKDLSLVGSGVGATVLDGEGCETLVAATAGESLYAEALTLSAADGRCVAAESGSVELVDVTLTDCGLVDGLHGPAVHVVDGDLLLRDSVVEGSEPGWEGPLDWPGAIQVEDGTGTAVVTVEDSTLSTVEGHALSVDGAAEVVVRRSDFPGGSRTGAMVVSAVDIRLEDSEIHDHEWVGLFEDEGGIATLVSDDGLVRIEGCTVRRNGWSHKTGGGGAIRVSSASNVVVRDSVFDQNTAVASKYYGASGAGLAVRFVDAVWILDSVFSDNHGATSGGGAFVSAREQLVVAGTTFVENSTDVGSASASSFGGGLYVSGVGGTVLVHDSMLCDNGAEDIASALDVGTGPDEIFLTHDVIADNRTAVDAVRLKAPSTLLHSVVLGNDAGDAAIDTTKPIDIEHSVLAWTLDGAGVLVGASALSETDLSWSAWWDNEDGDVADDDLDPADFDGTVEADPGFTWYEVGVDCRDADFALTATSPLAGAGEGGVDMGLCAGRTDADGDCFVAGIDPDDGDPDVIPGDTPWSWPIEGTPCTPVAAEDDALCPWDGTGGPDTGSGDTGGGDSGGGDSGGGDDGGGDSGGGDDGGGDGGGVDSGGGDDGGVDSGGGDDGGVDSGGGDDGGVDSGGGDDGSTDGDGGVDSGGGDDGTGDEGTGDDGTGDDGDPDAGAKTGCSTAPAAAWLGWLILAMPLPRRR